MSTIVRTILLPVMIILSTATPGVGQYYVDEPLDQVIHLSALAGSGPLMAGTMLEHLPDGARSVTIENTQYFVSSGNWFIVVFEGGIQYMVVLAPV